MTQPDAAILGELESRRDAILGTILLCTEAAVGVSEAEQRQFIAGYLDLVAHAAKGDLGARDAYLETVIPGIKSAGMPLDYVLAQMAGVAVGLGAAIAPKNLAWHAAFTREYVSLLVRQWSKS
jgi:hypothetical protein